MRSVQTALIGWNGHLAWDTCFVYLPGSLWASSEMPYPDSRFHQLKDREVWEQTAEAEVGTAEWTHALAEKSEADPAYFRTGDDLRVALEHAWEVHSCLPNFLCQQE